VEAQWWENACCGLQVRFCLCVVVMVNAMSIGREYAFLFTGIGFTVAGVEFASGLLLILEMLHLLGLVLLPF